MLRSSLLAAGAAILCTAASAQQTVQAKKVLGPVRDAGIYHVATGTWTRGGSTSNISPNCVYRNDADSGYFGTGWTGCQGTDEIMLPGTTNPRNGPIEAYTIDGMSFAYCKLGAGVVAWQFNFYDSYVPCDDPTSPANCINQLAQTYTFTGLPGGSACWIVTVDLAGGYELCMSADGGTCAPAYQGGGLGLDHGAVGHSWAPADGGTTGPLLNGNPTWDAPGGITCYRPAPGCPGSQATGLGIQDLFAITGGGIGSCAVGAGCYFFGGYVNLNGCNAPSNGPIAQFNLCLFSDCAVACTADDYTISCDDSVNPNNVGNLSLDSSSLITPTNNVTMTGAPASNPCYLLASKTSGAGVIPPGAKGTLCVTGMIGRYAKDVKSTNSAVTNLVSNNTTGAGPYSTVGNSDGTGGDNKYTVGETWNFQYWHRQGMNPSSFSDMLTVTFK